ncbi:VanW family protein [Virgibacillus pantothenticus]|uniref:YoaR-like putative peptidoglycan binding domain-containing protein n=1 Tax=Virgibacillus pantothenticus TaxID=1473 RepID=A0A0L0QMZ8_VIRPA|nr:MULTISPECIES: VanW family protein [Virgibacillus]API93707.1 hypothetical protein BKP57_18960 [Virgibacillus sp. 6R]KNE19995.1 hypothetical protein AFK71_16475 [Virgibacillus pantothenticus]MBS7429886.1 VanW family protein [Virgibacillus sp. 19R1-5]MBU8565018.1 VanW family protein [Virgibacillus pantothenticus]MBU8599325.1 VanW family protein [Virgibacillus pantothenticus]
MKRVIICLGLLGFILLPIHSISASKDMPAEIMIKRVEINQYALDNIDKLFINNSKLQTLIGQLKQKVYQDPINAKIDRVGKITPGKPGVTIDADQFQIDFREAFYNPNIQEFKVPVKPVYPRVDKGLLTEISQKQLGSYVTHFKKNNEERTTNIELAAQAIDSHVIFPGELFSFNKVVGERTEKKGYKRAPVIVKGELAEDIGGGICQVSSTLFNAVNLKGIEIVERYAHSKHVPYVPPGKDATVSWWGPDFSFKNRYNQPLLLRAHAKNGQLVVRVFSSDIVEHFEKDIQK